MIKLIEIIPLSIAGGGITVIELYALKHGVNGIALATALGVLGTIAGFIFKTLTIKKGSKKNAS